MVDDAPGATTSSRPVLDPDLQKLVNGLWQAGAEAISINGQRLTSLSAIRVAGDADHRQLPSLTRPYIVAADREPEDAARRAARHRRADRPG